LDYWFYLSLYRYLTACGASRIIIEDSFFSFIPSCFNQKEEMKENADYFNNTMCPII